ncbi:hypothetical protein ACIQU6_34980 [Streptomyces sp. NPDC090442]|uniref:hypothetical protein n=1 Tax=Streptomyces sp. NPDC090442 TaxID=3365962 RepID=UPI0037F68007
MATLVVGFRLGNDAATRQMTAVLTETGVIHRAQGLYGKLARASKPDSTFALTASNAVLKDEIPLARPVSHLRQLHTSYTKKGYTRALIPPVVVRLDVEERQHGAQHRELIQAFIGAAPNTLQSLDAAIREFRTALGLPSRPLNVAWVPRTAPIPPQVEAMLRTLAHGSPLTSSSQRSVR